MAQYAFAIEIINLYVRYEIGKIWKLKTSVKNYYYYYYYPSSYHYSLLVLNFVEYQKCEQLQRLTSLHEQQTYFLLKEDHMLC